MQKVTILNSGSTGATIDGEAGFGPWSDVSDISRLPALIEINAKGLIAEAHEITRERLAVPVLNNSSARYRQRLGSITTNDEKNVVLVEICYEVEDDASSGTLAGSALFRCR